MFSFFPFNEGVAGAYSVRLLRRITYSVECPLPIAATEAARDGFSAVREIPMFSVVYLIVATFALIVAMASGAVFSLLLALAASMVGAILAACLQ